jgi:hypothetical protein
MHQPAIAERAVALLRARGFSAEYEFPGVIEVALSNDSVVIAGTTNGAWETAVRDAAFEETRGLVQETVPLDAGAEWIVELVQNEITAQVRHEKPGGILTLLAKCRDRIFPS